MARSHALTVGWTVALGAVGVLAVLAVLPPVLRGDAGAFVHHAFAAVCHQLPERSPHLAGGPIALCHRCSGIVAGLLLGLVLGPLLGAVRLAETRHRPQGRWLVAALVPTALDWGVGALGLWSNTPFSRTLTGAVFGLAAGVILAANLLAVRRSLTLSPTLSS